MSKNVELKFSELQVMVQNKILELRKYSKKTWGVSPEMKVRFDINSISVLGEANHREGSMRLNKHLLYEFKDVYIDEVVVHEYAHFVVNALKKTGFFYANTKPHGKEFKTICRHFGISGKATTNTFSNSEYLKNKKEKLNTSRNSAVYFCDCNDHVVVSSILHKNMENGRMYSCPKCKSLLRIKEAKN